MGFGILVSGQNNLFGVPIDPLMTIHEPPTALMLVTDGPDLAPKVDTLTLF